MRFESARKSDCLETEASAAADGEVENSSKATDFKAVSDRNRFSIAYFGLK